MKLTRKTRNILKKEIKESLISEKEIQKIILFGSFLKSNDPKDIDIAIIQNSDDPYITLAMKYRKLTRNISKKIPLDIIPIKFNPTYNNWFISEIENGELIYER